MPNTNGTHTVGLGDVVEVTSAASSGPVRWTGVVCVIAGDQANVTSVDGSGAMAIRLDSPDLRVTQPVDPAIASCSRCQTDNRWLGRILCDAHRPPNLT